MTSVATLMRTPVVSVKPLDPVERARAIMEEHRINQLPVLRDGRLVGIVTDRDLRDAFPSLLDVLSDEAKSPVPPRNVRVADVMTPNVLTLRPDDTLVDAARLLRRERIGAAPVLDGERMVGILTRSDLLGAMVPDTTDSATERPRGRSARKGTPTQ